jgi:hypothetical protein
MTILDVNAAYKNLSASKRVMEYTAFRVLSSPKFGHLTLSFRSAIDGLCRIPALFSMVLMRSLSPRSRRCTIQHIDDILIHSKDLETHLEDIKSVFDDLLKANFLVSIAKMQSFKEEVTFLGHVLTGKSLKVPQERKSHFNSLAIPKTKKQLQSVLGLANYMSFFVANFQALTGPLYDAFKNKQSGDSIILDETQIKAFKQLKSAIVSSPELGLVDYTQPIYLECDASMVA